MLAMRVGHVNIPEVCVFTYRSWMFCTKGLLIAKPVHLLKVDTCLLSQSLHYRPSIMMNEVAVFADNLKASKLLLMILIIIDPFLMTLYARPTADLAFAIGPLHFEKSISPRNRFGRRPTDRTPSAYTSNGFGIYVFGSLPTQGYFRHVFHAFVNRLRHASSPFLAQEVIQRCHAFAVCGSMVR